MADTVPDFDGGVENDNFDGYDLVWRKREPGYMTAANVFNLFEQAGITLEAIDRCWHTHDCCGCWFSHRAGVEMVNGHVVVRQMWRRNV
jgi:hypothetical protein